ncbi:MAG: hypothetical protein HY881_09905 [Deltaproteobacteria bacterium]|nr:hypothetical protein [Deltaproteobacteria bacterium]
MLIPRNPKRTNQNSPTHINWFPYYAGFSSEFVHDVLSSFTLRKEDTILDPWNGSGTTTTTAYRLGAKVIGCDINPVMVVAAKSALLEPGISPSLVPLSEEILHATDTIELSMANDPLSAWYTPSSAIELRRIHLAIWRALVNSDSPPSLHSRDISNMSTIAAFFLIALMRTARHFLAAFVGSNPTWIRTPDSPAKRVRPSKDSLFTHFRTEVRRMAGTLSAARANGLETSRQGASPTISMMSSTSLPFNSGSIKAVVSSPPYLTRIDYAVATKPELAALGMPLSEDFDTLRKSMIGTPSVRQNFLHPLLTGKTCDSFLKAVEKHHSKGSHNYYHKLFVQYFSDMSDSLKEIARLLVKKGNCVLVVQDSFYKEIHVDLAQFVIEIAQNKGLSLIDRHDFKWDRNMVRVNTRARKYRESAAAVESVICFRKD